MPKVAITLDQGCCRCRTKIQNILRGLHERCGFVFDTVVYEKDKVEVSGPFDANDLYCKLQCKAGGFATKIEIVPPPPKKKKKKKKDTTKSPPVEDTNMPEQARCRALYLYPYACPCPNPQPTCPFSGATPPTCLCHSCRPPLPPPPPTPPRPSSPPQPSPPPPVCKCPTWTPCQCRGYPWVVCEQNLPQDGACAVM